MPNRFPPQEYFFSRVISQQPALWDRASVPSGHIPPFGCRGPRPAGGLEQVDESLIENLFVEKLSGPVRGRGGSSLAGPRAGQDSRTAAIGPRAVRAPSGAERALGTGSQPRSARSPRRSPCRSPPPAPPSALPSPVGASPRPLCSQCVFGQKAHGKAQEQPACASCSLQESAAKWWRGRAKSLAK